MGYSKRRLSSEKGFALITAIMACAILFALAMLILQLSTGDLRVSSRSVGDKKAITAAETGIQQLMPNFNPDSTTWTTANNYTTNCTATTPTYIWQTIASGADANTQYAICAPTLPTTGPAFFAMSGYSIGGGQSWGQRRYAVNVAGRNTSYNTRATINTGVGFGPIESSTMSR
jgi:Tfp pilus assembly protein PilX